jgi:hypothetical protein
VPPRLLAGRRAKQADTPNQPACSLSSKAAGDNGWWVVVMKVPGCCAVLCMLGLFEVRCAGVAAQQSPAVSVSSGSCMMHEVLHVFIVAISKCIPHAAAPCCAVLCCAVLCCAVLCCAVLCCAVLCCAVLCCAQVLAASPGGWLTPTASLWVRSAR